ncbi:hypothetical protein [Mucilaginibacter sp.]
MKNPFVKQKNTGLIAVASVVAAAGAGTLAYLYLTESGNEVRNSISHKLKDEFKNLVSNFISGKTCLSKDTVKTAADHVAE